MARREHLLCAQETIFEIYEATKRAFSFFFKKDLEMNFGQQDHCEAAMNAKTRAWPGIKVANCYPHASRMILKSTRSRLRDDENAQTIRNEFRVLHSITDTAVFEPDQQDG